MNTSIESLSGISSPPVSKKSRNTNLNDSNEFQKVWIEFNKHKEDQNELNEYVLIDLFLYFIYLKYLQSLQFLRFIMVKI